MQRTSSPYLVGSLARGLRLLSEIDRRGSLGVSEAAGILDVAPSTAHRLLTTLTEEHFTTQNHQRRYITGPALLSPGLKGAGMHVIPALRPYAERLFPMVAETVHIVTLAGTQVLHLVAIESKHVIRVGARTGVTMPAHHTSAGKAMLAELDVEEVKSLYRDNPPTTRKGEPIPMDELLESLAAIGRAGIGINIEESEEDMTAVGASVGYIGGQLAGMSVAMPAGRFSAAVRFPVESAVRQICTEARREVSDRIGTDGASRIRHGAR